MSLLASVSDSKSLPAHIQSRCLCVLNSLLETLQMKKSKSSALMLKFSLEHSCVPYLVPVKLPCEVLQVTQSETELSKSLSLNSHDPFDPSLIIYNTCAWYAICRLISFS